VLECSKSQLDVKRSKSRGYSEGIITLTTRRKVLFCVTQSLPVFFSFMNNVDEASRNFSGHNSKIKRRCLCALDFRKNRMGRKQRKVSSVKNQNLHLILHVCNVSLTTYLALSHRSWQQSIESSIVYPTSTFAMTPQYDLVETKTMFKQIFQSLVSEGLCFDKEEVLVQEARSTYTTQKALHLIICRRSKNQIQKKSLQEPFYWIHLI